MARVSLEVLSGSAAGRVFELTAESVGIGRAPGNALHLDDLHVSGEHARLSANSDGARLEDLGSTNGTWVMRADERVSLAGEQRSLALVSGDVIELGGMGDEATRLRVTLADDEGEIEVVALRPLGELGLPTAEAAFDVLKRILAAQRAIGSSEDLDQVTSQVADAALELVPKATHATVALRGDESDGADVSALVAVVTRTRGRDGRPTAPTGPVPLTRSVARKVLEQRAAVLAADASGAGFSSESLLGASIRSTIGVPLWKGERILGVLQVDSRGAPALFESRDVDSLGVLAASASLAVANARLIRRLLTAEQQLKKENQFLKGRERARSGEVRLIGDSRAMSDLLFKLDKVVDTRVSVLIEGETGVGKELIASALHYRSKRREKLFVAQNCAAFPENLLESELFGHKRGAFTGATDEKKGLFEIADGGTLFLDEIGEMPLPLQAKLLRVLQEGEIRPIGGTQVKTVNVRIVAATNRNLEQEVAAGRFREDLYYRLKVFPIRVPPLRERREDIPLLAQYFLERYTREIGKPVAGVSQETLEALSAYDWPGNVRELENEVQRLVIQADAGVIVGVDLVSPELRKVEGVINEAGAAKGSLKDRVEQVEKFILLEVLREHGNNKTSAAKALGITREGLHKKLKQLGIG
ncbi:MAG TPA: sigma 54-interacting transcriptional regulator [Polyangiaceae bacterium]|nr:sigma 54-interacting transcriptional regulator [Polyangiaceae bacterium]